MTKNPQKIYNLKLDFKRQIKFFCGFLVISLQWKLDFTYDVKIDTHFQNYVLWLSRQVRYWVTQKVWNFNDDIKLFKFWRFELISPKMWKQEEIHWVFATNSEFIIPMYLEPNVANLLYFKLTLFDLTEFIVWNI